jgi:predicted DNA-binding transcriptional regulator YafY
LAQKRNDSDRRLRQAGRLADIFRILQRIQSLGRWNAKALAEELECTERTVYRYLKVLEFAGVPFYFDSGTESYKVRADFKFPVLNLTEDEVLGQALSTAISKAPGLNIGSGSAPATRKLAAASSKIVQQVIYDAARLIEVFDLKLADHSKHEEAIRTAQFALLQGKRVTGIYQSPYEPKAVKLVIHPYRICLIKQAWYVIGHMNGETKPKTFRLARFRTLRSLDTAANVPDDFDLRGYFGNAWAVYRGDQSYDIELRFTADSAGIVQETTWHHTQKAKTHKDGTVTISFTVDGLNEIIHWILSWSGQVRVQKPDELKELYIKTLEDAVQMNSEAGPL